MIDQEPLKLTAEKEPSLNSVESSREDIDTTSEENQSDDLASMVVAKHASLLDAGKPEQKQWQNIVKWCIVAFILIIVGVAVFSLLPGIDFVNLGREIKARVDTPMFLTMLLTGFLAQMVDGSLGMGYGTISTTFLLATGVSPGYSKQQGAFGQGFLERCIRL